MAYYLGILQRRVWIIISLVIIGSTLGLIRSVRQPRIYMATTRVLVEKQGPNVMQFDQGGYEGRRWDSSYYETQTRLVGSRVVLEIALRHSRIRDLADRSSGKSRKSMIKELRRSLLALLGAAPVPLDEPWERLQEWITAQHVAETHFVDISAMNQDKESTVRLANHVAEAFETYHRQTREESLGDAFVKLEREKEKEELALLDAEQELQDFRESAQGVSLSTTGGKPQPAVERLNSLNRKLTEVQLQRIELESQIGVMETAMASEAMDDEVANRSLFAFPAISEDRTLTEAQQALAAAQEEYAMLAQTYGAAHPLLQAATSKATLLLEQFRTALQNLLQAERNRFAMLGNEERELRRQYAEQKASALELAKEDFQFTRLQNAVDRHRRLYDALVARMREVDVSAGLIQTNVRIVERASMPDEPVSPGLGRTVALSLMISLLLGVGLAFVFENLDDTVKTPEDLKERLTVPLLGFVPSILGEEEPGSETADDTQHSFVKELVANITTMVRDRLILMRPEWSNKPQEVPTDQQNAERHRRGMMVATEPASSVAEAYRGIRTSLFYSIPANTVRTLAVTSCRPQEGKTTTCSNLALSIAQTGKRVMLIDGDLHRPMLHRTLCIERRAGLTSILVGECSWRDAVERIEINKETEQFLDVITSGPASPNPSELLGSVQMREFVEEMQKDYDWVIIDTPPVLFVSDASVMSVLCDGVIVVVKSGTSTRTLLHRAREQLDSVSANILGSILNNVLVSRMGRHSSAYYNYGYSRYAKDYKSLYYASSDTEADEEPVVSAPVPPPVPVPEPAPAPVEEKPEPVVEEKAEPEAGEPEEADTNGAEDNGEADALSEPREYLVDAHPKSRYARQIRKALLLARAGHAERAEELIQSLLTLEPDDIPVREAVVRLKLDTGKAEEAEALAGELLAADPGNPYGLYVRGSMAIVRGEYDEAKDRLMESVTQRPQPESLNNLAWLLNETGRHEEAEPYASQAVEMDPSVYHAWDTLGLVLLKQGDVEGASEAFKKALKLEEGDICANLNMAEISVRQGRLRVARKLLRHLEPRQNEMLASERERFQALEIAAMKS